jgi:hypothetical protein
MPTRVLDAALQRYEDAASAFQTAQRTLVECFRRGGMPTAGELEAEGKARRELLNARRAALAIFEVKINRH